MYVLHGISQDVKLQTGVTYYRLCSLGVNIAAVHHAPEDVCEGGVCGWFGLLWHVVVP